jgi:hypothetical protein
LVLGHHLGVINARFDPIHVSLFTCSKVIPPHCGGFA